MSSVVEKKSYGGLVEKDREDYGIGKVEGRKVVCEGREESIEDGDKT